MGRFRDVAQGILRKLEPEPNAYMEEAKECLGSLPVEDKAKLLGQLAVAEEIRLLRSAVDQLGLTIYSKD